MQRDLSYTPEFIEMRRRVSEWFQAGSGAVFDVADIALSPDCKRIACAGSLFDKLEGQPQQRICLIDAESGEYAIVSPGPRTDRLPRWSPDGTKISYVADRDEPFNFQLQILDVESRTEDCVRLPHMWVEHASWSPDGTKLLIGAAGAGVDLAGAHGGIRSPLKTEDEAPEWAPTVDTGARTTQWRSLWTYAPADRSLTQISPPDLNVWEAAWCGNDAVVCVASDEPGEKDWYHASLRRIELESGATRQLYAPIDQLGWISASPDGKAVAFVEAVCSDRTIVSGVLKLIDQQGVRTVETNNVDVTFTAWQGEHHVLFAGVCSFETVLGLLDVDTGCIRDIRRSEQETFGNFRYPDASPASKPGNAAIVVEGHFKPATVVIVDNGESREICSFAPAEAVELAKNIGAARPCRWTAPDNLEIHGWVLTPKGAGPYPLVLDIHGGPVWLFRPAFLGRAHWVRFLLEAGYAVFRPNVRGSSARGQEYARRVFGDMGGADTYDHLSGLDMLIAEGVADPDRIGVMGVSYGGFMSSWLITQNQRFAAAVPIAPVTDWVSEHLTSHIPLFCEMFLGDQMTNPGGKYFTRSPIMYAGHVNTPTLNICGALDQNTPAGQALEFHRALLQHGVTSALVTYPQEGHGVRNYPAYIDFLVRVLGWFKKHMPPNAASTTPAKVNA